MGMHLVPLDAVDNVWPKVAPWIDTAIFKAKSDRTVMATYAQCRNGSLFTAVNTPNDIPLSIDFIRGVMLLAFYEHGGDRVGQFVFVAGDGDTEEWFEEGLSWDWFRLMGVTKFVCEGRPGWVEGRLKRMIPDLRVIRTVFEWRL